MDGTALRDQAEAAGAELVATHVPHLPPSLRDALAALCAIAWLEGRAAGGQEAAALIRDFARVIGGADAGR